MYVLTKEVPLGGKNINFLNPFRIAHTQVKTVTVQITLIFVRIFSKQQ